MTGRGPARWAAVAGAVVVLATAAPPASAHNYVVGTDPEDGATAADPVTEVSVTFNDVLLDMGGDSTVVDVTGPDGRHYATACPELSGEVVSAPVELSGAGEYTVAWRVVSADGHPVSGDFTFDHDPPSGADGATGTEAPVCGTSAAGSPSSGPDGTAGPDETATPSTAAIVAVALGTALLGGAVVLVVLRAGRRRAAGGSDGGRDVGPDGGSPPA
ncbi:copper resistance protein CopC [Isoptericola halotolerans]|uniref:copper resistance CopC family protein n=1 Tax=Isoptericola halotolerans TaxID=300560 RepID=UPI00388F2F6B